MSVFVVKWIFIILAFFSRYVAEAAKNYTPNL